VANRRITVPEVARVNAVSSSNMLRVHDFIARGLEAANDGKKAERLSACKCIYCFYLNRGRLVGHGFTAWKCLACDFEGQHSNTGVPRYCETCSAELNLCIECGGDLEMRYRRKVVRVRKVPRGS
jgi:hypothetical protein